MTHPAASRKPATKPTMIDTTSTQVGALVPMPRGRLDDAAFRIERARKARAAQNKPGHHLRQVIRAGSDHQDARWAVRVVAEQLPRTPAEIAAARHLAAALEWAADIAEVTP